MKIFLWIVVGVLFIDFLGFGSWALSGQRPIDDFHAGIITESIIHLAIK